MHCSVVSVGWCVVASSSWPLSFPPDQNLICTRLTVVAPAEERRATYHLPYSVNRKPRLVFLEDEWVAMTEDDLRQRSGRLVIMLPRESDVA